MKRLFLLGLQQVTVLLTFSYDFTCPPRSQWNQRAKGKCGNEIYHCLFDVNNDIFKEVCQEFSFPLDEGLKVVLRNYFDTEKCSEHLYMPFIIKTNESSDCAFLKSSCNEEGQITCRVRSEKEDAVCACNFLEGYAFLQTPKHISYCVPSEEDCSCFKKSEKLTQDYQPTPQDETCSLHQFYSIVISFHREKYNELGTEADMTNLQKREASGSEVPYSHRYKDILGGGILVLTLIIVMVLGYIFLEYQNEENIGNKENGIRENIENMEKGIHNYTEETNFEPELYKDNKSSENESFLFHSKGASIKPILKGEILKGSLKNEPRILDMCFMGDQQKLFLVWIDADNQALVRYKILPEDEYGKCRHFPLKDVPNRLSKINETKVAVIYKKKFEILIFNVVEKKEEMKYTINKDYETLLESGIQGFVFLNETEIILSEKRKLYKCRPSCKNGDEILIPERFGQRITFETARCLTRVPINTISEESKEIIIIADENDKKMTSLRGDDASIISQQSSHNRGLQNVRAIVATAKRVYAATSAGVSVYCHSNGNFDINKEHKMLLEYNVHVEHTRSLCLEEINGNVYFALSGVIKQKDFILIVNFEKDESLIDNDCLYIVTA